MRLDKFLKVSRLIKRRNVAKEVSEAGRVLINGRVGKPGSEVKVGDVLEIGFGSRQIRVEIIAVQDNVPAALAREMYRVLE